MKSKQAASSMLCRSIKSAHYWSARRKWNSTTEHKKSFFFFLFFSLVGLQFPLRFADRHHPPIHHIQLLRLFNQKSPFFLIFPSSALENQQEKRLSSHHSTRPAMRRWKRRRKKKLPNHHLGYVDVWSRAMLLQFPSGPAFFSLLLFFIILLDGSARPSTREEENCVYSRNNLDSFFFCDWLVYTPSLRVLLAPSQNVFCFRWTEAVQ